MCNFKQITLSPLNYENLIYIKKIAKLYEKYSKFLQDDFAPIGGMHFVLSTAPYLWAITKFDENFNEKFAGFVSLDNFTGSENKNFSAEVTTCICPQYWGEFTKICAREFFKKCFDEFHFYKIKALIFPDNFRVKTLLKRAGFKYETTLPSETIRRGKLQDIEVYSLKSHHLQERDNISKFPSPMGEDRKST